MSHSILNQPLTDQEFERLADFLDSIGPAAMNIEALDGYFAALICGPDMVMPSEYLPQIWGEDFSFSADNQARDILGLLMRHWNTIAGELRRTLSEEHVYLPVLLQDEVEAFSSMQEELDKEREVIMKQWAKREQQIERVMGATVGMYGDLQGIAGQSLQEIQGLELQTLDSYEGDTKALPQS
jgi:uncharacterized protein YecA (UPF0149 family)